MDNFQFGLLMSVLYIIAANGTSGPVSFLFSAMSVGWALLSFRR